MKLATGNIEIETIILSRFRLDGGAMFGSVPKNLWNNRIAADSENCIPLVARSLLISVANRKILVDVGTGSKWPDKLKQVFAINNTAPEALPFESAAITDVVLTHLHFDHAGGISYFADEQLKYTYPEATIHIQKSNLENALSPGMRESASYLKDNVHPVRDGKTNILNGDTELFENIYVKIVNGHTVGLQWLKIKTPEKTIVFPSDLIPTAHHIPLPYIMGYDMCAATALSEKEQFLSKAQEENWLVVYQHDKDTICSRVDRDARGRFIAVDAQAEYT